MRLLGNWTQSLPASVSIAALLLSTQTPLAAPIKRHSTTLLPQLLEAAPLNHLSAQVPANPKLATLFLVGSFSVDHGQPSDGSRPSALGASLMDLFDRSKINVVERTVDILGSHTAGSQAQWNETLALLKAGDIVLFAFGQDSNAFGGPAGTANVLPGIGDDLRSVDDASHQHPEIIHTYGWYLREYVVGTLARGATPILCSPGADMTGKAPGPSAVDQGETNVWTRQIAFEQRVAFLDLKPILNQVAGTSASGSTSAAATNDAARAIVAGLKGLPVNPLSGYLSARAAEIQPYRPPPPPAAPAS